jgi:hypothetical protein
MSIYAFQIYSEFFLPAQSVHMVVISSGDIDWHLHVHHTLSSVCFSFREIMKGISSQAFQFVATEANPR